jgi:hypothetical protein
MAQEIRNRAELKRRRELMRVAIERRAAQRLAASQGSTPAAPHAAVAPQPTVVAAASTEADRATLAVPPRPATKSTKHVNAMSADEDFDTRVVQHLRKNKLDEWLQQHAAAHKLRHTEVVNPQGRRAWNIDCDACGMTLSMTACVGPLLKHLKTATHVNALSADEDPDTRVVQHDRKNSVDEWLQQHAAGHKLRFTEVVTKRGNRAWNIGCDACGMMLSKVGTLVALLKHLRSAKHVNALSANEDVGTRVVQHAKKNGVDDWLQNHAAGHRMRFTEVVNARGSRAWIVDCDACGSTLSRVGIIRDLMQHLKSAKHVNALPGDEDPDKRVVRHLRKSGLDDWLQQHAAGHMMRFTELVDNPGRRAWNVECDACSSTMRRVTAVTVLGLHFMTATHIAAKLSSSSRTQERKRPRSR